MAVHLLHRPHRPPWRVPTPLASAAALAPAGPIAEQATIHRSTADRAASAILVAPRAIGAASERWGGGLRFCRARPL